MKKHEMKDGSGPRLARELRTITAMIDIYCRAHHERPTQTELCSDCRELLDYAGKRLSHCPFQEGKPTCGNCRVHCYSPRFREQIRTVMRFAGPRMLWSHPLMALRHLIDGRRKDVEYNKKASNPAHLPNTNRKNP